MASFCVLQSSYLTHTKNSADEMKGLYRMRGREGVPQSPLWGALNQWIVHKMFTSTFLFFTLCNHGFMQPSKSLSIKSTEQHHQYNFGTWQVDGGGGKQRKMDGAVTEVKKTTG